MRARWTTRRWNPRPWLAGLVLAPLALLAGASNAAAAGRTGPGAPLVLPPGVHFDSHGHYVRDLCDHAAARFCLTEVVLPEWWMPGMPIPAAGTGGANGMSPTDVVSAYNIPASASSGGAIVAILDSPDSNALADLNQYRSNYGLPAMTKCSGPPTGTSTCFAQVNETGGTSSGADSGQSDGETSLDMDMISAACPDCSILLVELDNLTDTDITTGVATAAKLGAVAISISLGGAESGGESSSGYTSPGHLVLAASGDFAYDNVNNGGSSPSFPSSAPTVLAVGGTNLFNNGSSYDEAVWDDNSGQPQDATTSGCSTEFPMPTWQQTALSGSGCSKRATADVSAAAAFTSGGQPTAISTYATALGGFAPVEGTSASSPMMAGIFTRLGLTQAISSNLGWVYTNASAFNDLGSSAYPVDPNGTKTDAPSGTSCGILCTAGSGWDGPSGVGTPNGTKLAALGTSQADAGAGGGGGSAGGGGGGSSGGGGGTAGGGGTGGSGGSGGTGGGGGSAGFGGSGGNGGAGGGGDSVSNPDNPGSATASYENAGDSRGGCGLAPVGVGDGLASALVVGAALAIGRRRRR
jgi:hypothetical protein